MTNITNATPGSLRAFLDAGGDPTTLYQFHMLRDYAVDSLTWAPDSRAGFAQMMRHDAAAIRRGQRVGVPKADGGFAAFGLADAHSMDWHAELFEDPSLAQRLIDSFPELERAKAYSDLDHVRRPHPLDVETPVEGTQWSCNNCGEAHDVGDGVRAVIIGWREDWSNLPYRLTYCAACIGLAAQALNPPVLTSLS